MSLLKAFVSSTCYDLNIVRNQLRSFLFSLGHEPVMSDYNDILFDPRSHTHESCVKEISNADIVILIVGSRFGGTAIPKAVSSIDMEFLKTVSKSTKILEPAKQISVTQVEILKAIELNIPIFAFIDTKVLHDHLFYEKNKDKGILDSIEFPSIEKKESAVYIFEFINFLRHRTKNNSIVEFSKMSDIEEYMKKQLSALLQQLLHEQKSQKLENRRLENFSDELKDIKSLILSSITTDQAKEVGRGVLKYRKLVEFIYSIDGSYIDQLLLENISWKELLEKVDIVKVVSLENPNRFRPISYLIRQDGTFYEVRWSPQIVSKIEKDWHFFKQLPSPVKQEVISTLSENFSNEFISRPVRHRDIQFEDYVKELTGIKYVEEVNISTDDSTIFLVADTADGESAENIL